MLGKKAVVPIPDHMFTRSMTWKRSRLLTYAISTLAAVALLTAGLPATAGATPMTAPAQAPKVRPMTVGVLDIAKGAYAAYGKYKTCKENIKVGQSCTASDSSNIRAILQRLADFEQKVQANHDETIARFDVLENTLNSRVLDEYVNALRPLEINGENAMRAFLAMSDCLAVAEDIGATCQAYIGGADLEEPQNVHDAIEESERYFLEQVDFMGRNTDVFVAEFAGTSVRNGTNGLAHSVWKLSKRLQDQKLGVTKSEVINSNTTPVVTKETADEVNRFLDTYEEIFDRYGYLLVMAAGFKGGPDGDARARSMQATINNKILSDQNRYSLRGAAKHYRMPVMQDSELTVVLAGKPVIISGKPGLGRDLVNDDITQLATTLNYYSKTQTVSDAIPEAFPNERLYTVKAHVKPFKHILHTCIFLTGCLYTADVTSHSLSSSKSPTVCPVEMRPMNSKPTWDTKAEYWMYADPSMGRDFFWDVWTENVKGAVDYQWATGTLVGPKATYNYGWGALVSCQTGDPVSSAHELNPTWYPMVK